MALFCLIFLKFTIFSCFCRYGNFEDFLAQIQKTEGGLEKFAEGYKQFGPQVGIS
jgi:hypothetical protein